MSKKYPDDINDYLATQAISWLQYHYKRLEFDLQAKKESLGGRIIIELSNEFVGRITAYHKVNLPLSALIFDNNLDNITNIYGMEIRANPSLSAYEYRFVCERELKIIL